MPTNNAWNSQVLNQNVTFSGGTMSMCTDATDHVVNIGTGANIGRAITIGNATGSSSIAITSGTGSVTLTSTGTGDIILNSSDTCLIDSAGVLELNSSAGIISIGNDAVAQNINIGTGAAARTVTIGNVTSTTGLVLNAGTGSIALTSTSTGDITLNSGDTCLIDAAGALELNSSAGVISIGNDAVAQNINVGTGAAARTITIGNTTTTTAVVINAGTGNIALTSTGTGDITIDSDDTLLLDADGVLELNSSAGAISIGNDADAQAINIGTGAAARTITIGNTTSTTDLDLRCGTGDFTLASATGTIINAADTGEINYPLQPCFLATNSTPRSNVTGDGTVYTLIFDTERFDQNSDWDGTSTFTAPVTGRYYFGTTALLQQVIATMTSVMIIVTSNKTYIFGNYPGSIAAGNFPISATIVADLDAADTAQFQVNVGGGTKVVDISGDATDIRTWLSGFLVC